MEQCSIHGGTLTVYMKSNHRCSTARLCDKSVLLLRVLASTISVHMPSLHSQPSKTAGFVTCMNISATTILSRRWKVYTTRKIGQKTLVWLKKRKGEGCSGLSTLSMSLHRLSGAVSSVVERTNRMSRIRRKSTTICLMTTASQPSHFMQTQLATRRISCNRLHSARVGWQDVLLSSIYTEQSNTL